MVVRSIVALFHLLVAAVTFVGFGALLVQARLNLAWELAFYDEASDTTVWLVTRALLGVFFASLETAAAIAFIPGGRAAGHAMVLVSMLLAWTAGWPLNAFLGLAGVAGVMEVWAHLPRPEPAEEEEEED